MTNYIEQLMKKAGVDSEVVSEQILTDYGVESVGVKQVYPAFTPEKQLELIKLLGKRKGYGCIGEQVDYFTEMEGLKFDKSVAQITSNAISSKILDKPDVRRILEDD